MRHRDFNRKSSRLPVICHFNQTVLRDFPRDVNPAWVAVACDLNTHDLMECILVDTAIAMAHDRPVDVPRDNEGNRIGRHLECPLDGSGIEQAECDIERLSEASVGIVVDFSCMHDDADTQLPWGLANVKACVVVDQEPAESGYGMVQQYCLWRLFHGVDESKDAVATVNEWVTMRRVDFRQAQRLIEQLINLVAKLGLNRIGTGGGLLDVERDDGPVMRPTPGTLGVVIL